MPSRTPRFRTDLVVLDLEASCPVRGANEIEESNIIEIGAVRLDRRTLEETASFSELVRPRDHPVLPFITELTGISADMVAEADSFERVGARFTDWAGPRNKFILAAFGVYYDLPLLRKEFRVFGLDYGAAFVGGGLDIRSLAFLWLARNGRDTGGITLERTLEKMGIEPPSGPFHRALEDARAAAAVLRHVWAS